VNLSVLEVFLPAAEKLIAERGAEKALATCLAVISGTTELSSRSLLSSFQDYTTYHMHQNLEMHGSGLIWNTLRRYFDADLVDGIKGMRMTKDKLGCVFDVPNDKLTALKEAWTGDRYCTLEAITELPELLESQNFRQNQNRFNGGGQSRGGGFNNGGQSRGGGFNNGQRNGFNRKRSAGQNYGGPPAKKWT
jgi:ATP-dependent RNA helicase DDX21